MCGLPVLSLCDAVRAFELSYQWRQGSDWNSESGFRDWITSLGRELASVVQPWIQKLTFVL